MAAVLTKVRSAEGGRSTSTRPYRIAQTPDATHNAPAVTASARGALPTSYRRTTLFAPGSTCSTWRPSLSATHSDPPPNATAAGVPPTAIRTASSRVRSMRETVPSAALAIHTEPPPPVAALGSAPTGICFVMRSP